MALPTENTALDEFFGDLLFTGAYLSASKGLVAQGRKVLAVRKKVQEAVTARNDATDAWMLTNVAWLKAWEDMRAPLESFERQVDAHFDADREAYGGVFKDTVLGLLRASGPGREDALKPVLAFASKSGHAGKLGATGKEVVAAWHHYTQKAKEEADASAALEQAVRAVLDFKRRGVVTMRETDGQLRSHFAEAPAQSKRFFRAKAGKISTKPDPSASDVKPSPAAGVVVAPAKPTPAT